MNCQVAKRLVEDALDKRLSGAVKRQLDHHLAQCRDCRSFYEAEQAEHARWLSAMNDTVAEPPHPLPPDFADRLVASVLAKDAAQAALASRFRMPRWLKRAAGFAALLSGVAFAAMVVVEAVVGGGSGKPAQTDTASSQSPSSANQLVKGNGENKMKIKAKAPTALAAVLLSGGAYAADYTWMASPADANWNTSSLNWNAGEAWVDDSAAPNNAIFPSTSSQKTITIPSGQTRHVNDLDVNGAYTIQGDGKLDLAGTFSVNYDCTFNAAFDCPTVRFGGTSGKILKFDTKSTGSTQTSTYINSSVKLNLYGDKTFGPQPTQPTDNIFITSGTPIFLTWVPWNTTLNQNRTIRISPYAGLSLGGNTSSSYTSTIKSLILADNSPGQEFSTNTVVSVPADWTGQRVLDPGDGRTNIVGRLKVESRLRVESGVTRLGSAKSETGASAMLYIKGSGSSYSGTKGNLEIAGGTLYASQGRYVDVSSYGQVTVKDGGRVYMPSVTWLNGHSGRGKLTVTNGEFTVSTLRINQSSYSEVHLEEGGLIAANVLAIETGATPQGLFRFNGGRLQARDGTARGIAFLTAATDEKWSKLKFGIGEGGAVFDTSNGQNIWWRRPLMSDAEHDGGVKKLGGNLLIFTNTNGYNGVTHVAAGGLQLRVDNALPPGSTLRLGGSGTYVDSWTFENASPARATEQWLGRVEGAGSLSNCSNLHVTNALAPAVDGTLAFSALCDLRGDLEISGNTNGCGCIKVAAGQDISGLKLKVADFSTLDSDAAKDRYQILSAPEGYSGTFVRSGVWPNTWDLKYTATGVFLRAQKGLIITIR